MMEKESFFCLEGKVALVCGASQGLGKSSALALARLGASVVGLARNEASLHELQRELAVINPEGQHASIVADMDQMQQLQDSVSSFIAQSGSIDILVNNSGGPNPGPIHSAQISDFTTALQRHLFSAHLLAQLVIPGMKDRQFGRILNIISTSVKTPLPGLGVSNTTRAAVASWGKTLAMELAPFGITVNSLLPGAFATDRLHNLMKNRAQKMGVELKDVEADTRALIPMGRIGRPEEFGAMVAMLATPASSYVTGVALCVDGGRTPTL